LTALEKSPLLILCPMRSFSSVLCAMLGQHPQTYGLPEVNLFIADTVYELLRLHTRRPHGMHGLLRALAQLHDGEQSEKTIDNAREWLDEHQSWSTCDVFDHIIDAVAPRIAIDKTPRTVLRPEYLARAYEFYPQARFLHVTRHPLTTGNSLLANVSKNAEWGGTFSPDRIKPEQIWIRAHQNIVDMCERLPLGQWMRIKGEDLLSDPECYLPQIAEWLEIDTDTDSIAAMMYPERSPFACPGPSNAFLGNDPDFLKDPALRKPTSTQPRLSEPVSWLDDEHFSKPTLKLARQFGYA
jgi:hypothetical protein